VFLWAVLSGLYPPKWNPERVSNYVKGIDFPMEPKNISKFVNQNPSISINVISPDSNNKGFCIEYLSPERNRQHHINFLLFADPDSMTSHYVYIKNFSQLLGD